jgi:hypothetical protein
VLLAGGCARGASDLEAGDVETVCDSTDCGLPTNDAGQGGTDALGPNDTGCDDFWFVDGDGFGDADKGGLFACEQPANHAASDGDCDDGDSSSYPGATEMAGDGVDQDCDDDNPEVYGGAQEICDGIDNDCDSLPETIEDCPCPLIENLGSRYLICGTLRQWTEARTLCEGYGYALVTVDDAVEDQWIAGQMDNQDLDVAWLGASDGQTEGVFVWVDGAPVAYAGWREEEPNDKGTGGADGGADCAARIIGGDAGWADRSCADEYGFICERR